MNDKILNLLRSQKNYVSGEEISRHLGISRSAIWKHIQELRLQGYEIIAVPHLGYELASSPDQLLPQELSLDLNTKIIGREIYHYDTVTSTMDVALDLAMKNCPEGTVVCAEGQYKGRGRLGRFWSSVKNRGIYLSLVLRPKISPMESPKLTILAAVSACQAIRDITKLGCLIKWPNDLMVNDNKAGGILTEMNAETDMVKFVIIGIGINVNTPQSLLPSKATSLKDELGQRVCRVQLTRQILKNIEKDYILFQRQDSKYIIEKAKKYSCTLGHKVRVHFHKEFIEGQAVDIDSDGALLVKKNSGVVERITAGDVVKVK